MLRNASRILIVAAVLFWSAAPARAAESELTKCDMTFTLKGWSAVYKTAHGQGEVSCANGESMPRRSEAGRKRIRQKMHGR